MDHLGSITTCAAIAIIVAIVFVRQWRRIDYMDFRLRYVERHLGGDDAPSSQTPPAAQIVEDEAEWWKRGEPNPYDSQE